MRDRDIHLGQGIPVKIENISWQTKEIYRCCCGKLLGFQILLLEVLECEVSK
jgi:hypothetical protein